LPYKNEVIDLRNKKISKNYHIKSIAFQTHFNKSCPKKVNILFVIKFTRNFEFQVSNCIKNIGDSVGESNHINRIKNSRSMTSICTWIPKYSKVALYNNFSQIVDLKSTLDPLGINILWMFSNLDMSLISKEYFHGGGFCI
jgi:hypothetical protein